MKKVLCLFITALCCILAAQSVNALTYQHEVKVQFTFNDVLSLMVDEESIDLGALNPGQNAVSTPVTLTVNTNYLYGYSLLATVGDTNHDYRELMRTDGEESFASLATDASLATLANETNSVWGYALSTDSGTTWGNFSGLPKYDSDAKLLNSSNGAVANDATNFRVGAKVKNTQAPGTYSNVVNFVLLTNPGKTYIQDITPSQCGAEEITVYDRRDETAYTIGRVGGKCWLLENLSLDLVATSLEQLQGNTNASNDTLNYLKNGGGRSVSGYMTTHFYGTGGVTKWTATNSYSVPMFYDDVKGAVIGNDANEGAMGKRGIYYNFCAATAGSFCMGSDNSSGTWTTPNYPSATEDICPSGWRLPSAAEYTAHYTDSAYGGSSTSAELALHLPRGGSYYSVSTGFSSLGNRGYFWAPELASSGSAKALYSSKSGWGVDSGLARNQGANVRCVLDES